MKGNSIVVVTVREWQSSYGTEVDAVAFSSMNKANVWVENQINEHIRDFDLDRDNSVDGWRVEIEPDLHTIEYEALIRVLQ